MNNSVKIIGVKGINLETKEEFTLEKLSDTCFKVDRFPKDDREVQLRLDWNKSPLNDPILDVDEFKKNKRGRDLKVKVKEMKYEHNNEICYDPKNDTYYYEFRCEGHHFKFQVKKTMQKEVKGTAYINIR